MMVMIMAGGTGGHVYPALAVAKHLQGSGHQAVWLGSKRGIENKLVPENDIELERLSILGLRGNGIVGWLKAPFVLTKAVWEAVGIIKKHKPNVVLGLGGFASGPGGVAARVLGTPLVIHEQNAVAGLTNKILAKISTRVLEAFPGSFKTSTKLLTVGNPVRVEIENILPKEEINQMVNVLVVGGSLGALALNKVLPEAFVSLKDKINLWHQTGKDKLDSTLESYADLGLSVGENLKVGEYIDDMVGAFSWADLVVCRAGAMTVFEIAACGRAAIFVPYPYAVDDHQTANAGYLTQNGAAQIISQDNLTASSLVSALQGLVESPAKIVAMGHKAKEAYIKGSAAKVAEVCLEVAR
jgi:UDP-N-acetylglucosamine--N-acetylmuramyl-(pentapeptide) pyrophosphoryl-undecaprenol N-acetylglucosamine transferase